LTDAVRSVLPRLVAQGLTPEERPGSLDEHERILAETAAAMGESAPVTRIFAGYIEVVYLISVSEYEYQWANAANLVEAGLSVEEAHALALANLAKMSIESLSFRRIEPAFGYFQSNFASSLILLGEDFWEQFDLDRRELVFGCPVRDLLLFAPRGYHRGVCKLANTIVDFWRNEEIQVSHKLSDHLLQCGEKGSWELVDVGPYLN